MMVALGFGLGVLLAASYVLLLRWNTRLYTAESGSGWAVLLHFVRLIALVSVMALLGYLGKQVLLYGLLGFVPTHLVLYMWLRRQPDDLTPP
ncbi:MAG: hypothetical protein JNM83_04250 [Myxococcales bacterium]|jgi:hypothetical protein|nr:hypothetical protein [Myxococcales bacterium]